MYMKVKEDAENKWSGTTILNNDHAGQADNLRQNQCFHHSQWFYESQKQNLDNDSNRNHFRSIFKRSGNILSYLCMRWGT